LVEALAISDRADWWWGQSQSRLGLAVLAITEGNPGEALAILEPVIPIVEALGVYEWPIAWAVPEAIEALVADNQLDRAARLTDALSDWGRRFDRPWASALSGRGRAMVEAAQGHLPLAQAAAEQAVVDHERLPMPFELGRTLLVLGQIQRRRGERLAARATLRQSRAIFESLPAPLWAARTRAEERRIGIRRTPMELTENERLVAQLAAGGLTNRDIAARLFLSRRTVEANLARAYRKLGIHSRAELGATMTTGRDSAPS
jgi:DNA-binding CsgD family transcriptional regulator